MPPPDVPKCATCKWYVPDPSRPGLGACHLLPPVDGIYAIGKGALRAPVPPTEWCQSYQKS